MFLCQCQHCFIRKPKNKRNRNYPKETCGITNLIRNNCSRSTLGLFHLRWFSPLLLLQSQPRISDVEFAFACPRQNVIETTLKKRVASQQHQKTIAVETALKSTANGFWNFGLKARNRNYPKVNLILKSCSRSTSDSALKSTSNT